MADELTISLSMDFTKSGVNVSISKAGLTIDVSGSKYTRLVQNVGTSEEALDIGDIGTAGYCFIRNLDPTNYVSLRPGSGTANFIKLKAGEAALFRLALNGPYAIANSSACNVEIVIIED